MYFPIGDIHGCYDMLRPLYDKILAEIRGGIDPSYGATIVSLGDYIDRNKGSDKVLDFVMGLEDGMIGDVPLKHVMLRGNHEALMINTRRDPTNWMGDDVWLNNGGDITLDDFGVTLKEFKDGALDNYVVWMEKLPIIVQDDDYVFVHAGVHEGIPLDKQLEEYCLWDQSRDPAVYKNLDKVIVHGHMIKKNGPLVDLPNNRIWMDVGTGIFNRLCALCLPEPYDYGYEGNRTYKVLEVKRY